MKHFFNSGDFSWKFQKSVNQTWQLFKRLQHNLLMCLIKELLFQIRNLEAANMSLPHIHICADIATVQTGFFYSGKGPKVQEM